MFFEADLHLQLHIKFETPLWPSLFGRKPKGI